MMGKQFAKNVFMGIRNTFIRFCGFWFVYAPVFAGLLSIMMFVYGFVGTFFLFSTLSWVFADPAILLTGDSLVSWTNSYLAGPIDYERLVFAEQLVFLFGLVLFVIALMQLARGVKRNDGLYRGGLYRYIRHPQNLAVIIMALPLALYIPHVPFFLGIPDIIYTHGLIDEGIRLADLISWVQFIFIVIVYSDWEDKRLREKYADTFDSYYETTGFMFPKWLSRDFFRQFSRFKSVKKRYALLLAAYTVIVGLFYLVYLLVPTYQFM
ncbi:MAG: methyltransferase family protein [Candidatus Odinarchaeota archaeon]